MTTTRRAACRSREWRPEWPVDLHASLGPLRHGPWDPAQRVTPDGCVWRACRTPQGPGTLRVGVRRRDGVVDAEAWGPGGDWLLDGLPDLLGAGDDASGFVPGHPLLRDVLRRHAGWRVPRTGLVLESLLAAVLEQKVTSREAHRSWRELLTRFGEPAPAAPDGMRVPPDARAWATLPSWEWHRAGVGPQRADTAVRAARVAGRLEETVRMSHAEAERRLRAVPGVGVWTAAEVRQRAHGDPDAVSVGDLHLPGQVGMALCGHPVDDAGMLALLAPYAGHRYRAVRLVELAGVPVPRRAPKHAVRDFRRV
ncbi:MAG: DNA-3-methyladenine glycosylase family protein [Actinomycetes bacterium]